MSHTDELRETLAQLEEIKMEFLGLKRIEKDLEELEEMVNDLHGHKKS